MPTIAELLAAKSAAAKPPVAAGAPAGQKTESLAERMELKETIDRIDPPGKHRAGGIVLRKEEPSPPRSEAPRQAADPRRSLSVPDGQDIPQTPCAADRETATWHEALQAFETELCLIRHPTEPEQAWLAVKPERPGLPPILIHRLPWRMWEPPWGQTTNEPF